MDQLPSISKKVRWRLSPTSKISSVRKHFCEFARRLPLGCSLMPIKCGTSGCIPAVIKSTVLSSGRIEAEGMIVCPLEAKKSKNFWRISSAVMIADIIIFFYIFPIKLWLPDSYNHSPADDDFAIVKYNGLTGCHRALGGI